MNGNDASEEHAPCHWENQNCLFLKVEFDDNKDMCRNMGVKILPYFHMYKGKKGKVAEFSASITKVARIRENLAQYRVQGAAK